jgi:hypothetical protein
MALQARLLTDSDLGGEKEAYISIKKAIELAEKAGEVPKCITELQTFIESY